MSLVYQSLKKLQSGEDESGTGPGPPWPPDRHFRLRSVARILLGLVLLGAAVYIAWIMAGDEPPKSSPPNSAKMDGGRPADTGPADNASRSKTAKKDQAKQSDPANETEQAATSETVASADTEEPALLRLSCRSNGTRARLSLEFDREPANPKTRWNNKAQTLDVAFPSAVVTDAQSLLERTRPKGLDLTLPSSDPLHLRLKVPELKEHDAFTLLGSADYGPRYVLVLRFAPESKQNGEPSKTARASRSETPDDPQGSPRSKQGKDDAAEPKESPRPESGEQDSSGSMAIASSASQEQSRDGRDVQTAGDKRFLDQKRSKSTDNQLLRRLQNNPENIDLRTRYAEELVSQERYRRALQVLQLDNPPNVQDNIDYYALAAYASRKLGRNKRAARIYQTLVEKQPRHGRWWMGLGLCLERTGRSGVALKAYERALASSGLGEEVRSFLRQRKKRLEQGQSEE